jgi:hypothetical protein
VFVAVRVHVCTFGDLFTLPLWQYPFRDWILERKGLFPAQIICKETRLASAASVASYTPQAVQLINHQGGSA